jgi:hypothetical protein
VFGLATRCGQPLTDDHFFWVWWWAGSESNTRHKDFQFHYKSSTIVSKLISIDAFSAEAVRQSAQCPPMFIG